MKQWGSQGIPSITNEQLFQPIFPTKTNVSTQRSVFWENGSQLCLPGDLNNESADLKLHQCHWGMFFQYHLQSKPIILTWWALCPRRPKWMCKGFPVSVMKALHKTISQVSLSYKLHELCLLGDLNEHAEASLCQWWKPFKRSSSE